MAILKEDSKTECGNYRPISVIDNILDNNIIAKQQSGFRPQHSTETALIDSTNEWLFNKDNGLISGVLFLDLKKAFDTINHEILISKLKSYGVKGHSLKWFKSYIQGRKQVCSVNNKLSNTREINCRIPQGSNLGPLLFLLYINDLPNCLETTNSALFADDTSILCEGFTATEIVN